jgi:hypothetical protein
MKTGEVLANEGGLAALLAASTWSEKADVWFESLLPGDTFTSEDLTSAIGFPDKANPNSNNAVGAKIRAWSHRKQAERRGYMRTIRSVSHARMIVLWEKR